MENKKPKRGTQCLTVDGAQIPSYKYLVTRYITWIPSPHPQLTLDLITGLHNSTDLGRVYYPMLGNVEEDI